MGEKTRLLLIQLWWVFLDSPRTSWWFHVFLGCVFVPRSPGGFMIRFDLRLRPVFPVLNDSGCQSPYMLIFKNIRL